MAVTLRIVIIHRKRLFREGLGYVLSQQQDMTVVGCVAEVHEIMEELARLRPDVILIDFPRLERDALGDVQLICMSYPEVKILMMGLTELESDVLACIEAGATGYLSQEASLEELVRNVRAVAAGEALCSPKIASFLISRIAQDARERKRRQGSGLTHLTRREREIVALLEEGLSNKEIAVRLQIELQTVKNHVHNILDKLQLNSRREAARYVREQSLLRSMH